MSRTLLSAVLLLAACGPAQYVDTKDDAPSDSDGVPTEETDDTEEPGETGETGLVVNPPDTDDRSNLPPLDCHPYDPVSYGGWSRRYSLKVAGSPGAVEAHTSLGLTDLPDGVNAPQVAAPAYKVQVTNAGSNNYQATYWNDCANDALRELAYTYTVQNKTLKAAAPQPQKVLPDEAEFSHTFQPTWPVETNYKIRVPTGYTGPILPGCTPFANGTRTVKAQYTGMGFEDITVQGLGLVEAYRMTVILDQTQTLQGGFNPLCLIFGGAAGGNPLSVFFAFFQAASGFTPANPAEDGAYITAQIDRWYVRGVGLVKETSVDYLDQGRVLYEKTLTQCSGLPNCK